MSYGDGDATYRACGESAGLRRLVEAFYAEMDTRPEAKRIRAMHPKDLSISIDKLHCFLVGWTGGPKRYAETYGPIQIPAVHRHLRIGEAERDAWLACMARALEAQPWPAELEAYLLRELSFPAERVREASEAHRRARSGG